MRHTYIIYIGLIKPGARKKASQSSIRLWSDNKTRRKYSKAERKKVWDHQHLLKMEHNQEFTTEHQYLFTVSHAENRVGLGIHLGIHDLLATNPRKQQMKARTLQQKNIKKSVCNLSIRPKIDTPIARIGGRIETHDGKVKKNKNKKPEVDVKQIMSQQQLPCHWISHSLHPSHVLPQAGLSFLFPWWVECGDICSRVAPRVLYSLMGWLHTLHGSIWNSSCDKESHLP